MECCVPPPDDACITNSVRSHSRFLRDWNIELKTGIDLWFGIQKTQGLTPRTTLRGSWEDKKLKIILRYTVRWRPARATSKIKVWKRWRWCKMGKIVDLRMAIYNTVLLSLNCGIGKSNSLLFYATEMWSRWLQQATVLMLIHGM